MEKTLFFDYKHTPTPCTTYRKRKKGKNVEFGTKINKSHQQGYARIDQIDFEAFNEGVFLKEQVERYKKLNGHYP